MKPWEGYLEPFKIFGNLYFVGTTFVSSHIIDTGDGLILIDSQYPQSLYLLLENIRALGFDPADIKYVLHSHGHYDHIGGTRAIVELYGNAKTVIGRQDRDYVNGTLDLTWAKELGHKYLEMFEPDILLDDGDTLKLGNTEIKCINTPGHTPGVMSFFFDVTDGERILRAGMFGGGGMNSMKLSFLDKYSLPHSLRDDFLVSLDKVYNERVDIIVGNHPGDSKIAEKYPLYKAGDKDIYVDSCAWKKRLDLYRQTHAKMVESGE